MHKKPLQLSEVILNVVAQAFPKGGFYIEAGAHDGVSHSNTLILDRLNWTGLLIEPSPDAFKKLSKSRPSQILENVALVGDGRTLTVTGTFADGSLMASAHPELQKRDAAVPRNLLEKLETHLRGKLSLPPKNRRIEVPAKTLDRIIRDHLIDCVDLFVLDVEGLELEVLLGFGFSPKPRLMIIETRSGDAAEIANVMLSAGYVLAANFSNFSRENNPQFSGDHQDYVWVSKDDSIVLRAVLNASV